MKKKSLFLSLGAGSVVALGLGMAVATTPVVSPAFAEENEPVVVEPVQEEVEEEITPEEKQNIIDEIKATVTSALNEWDINNIFTPQNIMSFISFLLSGGFGVALVKVYAKYKGEITVTRKAVESSIEKLLPEVSEKVLSEIVTKVLEPLAASVGSMEEAMGVFSRCLALAQEGTPESRLAILKELESIKIKDESIIAKVDEAIKKAVEEGRRQIDEKLKLLENMEALQKAAENAPKKESVVEKENGTDI